MRKQKIKEVFSNFAKLGKKNTKNNLIVEFSILLYLTIFTNAIIVFANSNSKLLTTSNDVIHSVWFPGIGIKLDSIPGSLNSIVFNVKFKGFCLGGCSELCGIGHSKMPISLIKNLSWKGFFNLSCF